MKAVLHAGSFLEYVVCRLIVDNTEFLGFDFTSICCCYVILASNHSGKCESSLLMVCSFVTTY